MLRFLKKYAMISVTLVAITTPLWVPIAGTTYGNPKPQGGATAPSSPTQETKAPVRGFKILCLGDSLTDGYGVPREAAWPALLAQHLKDVGKNHVLVVNAGLSGSTSASGLSRLQWQLKSPQKPDLMILALGANDGLRGIDVSSTRKNLDTVIELAKKEGIKTVLAGMQMPTNYGASYTQEFASIFKDLAQTHALTLIPFLLEGVATVKELNQSDGIHPNEAGYKRVVQNIIPIVVPLVPSSKP